ncbi:hypothetical protein LSH36_251g02002 [Paralvinella palmiformis]|uniref:Uncharacterized protein n=1 Tax=Paralvinella palmiformis TaxID=53620 RepID=A0AAD9JLJ9_9ANNE|nr:hypothetical protein LSH36_251g02002 [Paralvinella palmiformis]
MDSKDNVTWSYSQYIDTLDKEAILNNVDEMTFSSLTLNSQETGTNVDEISDTGDRMSVAVSNKPDPIGKPEKQEPRRYSKVDDADRAAPIKSQKPIIDTSESASQTDAKRDDVQQRVVSPKEDQLRSVKLDGRAPESGTNGAFALVPKPALPTTTGSSSSAAAPGTKTATSPAGPQLRLQRRMPPLVGRPE